jgi:hypothetical protein
VFTLLLFSREFVYHFAAVCLRSEDLLRDNLCDIVFVTTLKCVYTYMETVILLDPNPLMSQGIAIRLVLVNCVLRPHPGSGGSAACTSV